MKTYFKTGEIAHIWANLTSEEIANCRDGRCPSAMTFRGSRFYSYAACIGKIVETKKGRAYIVNGKRYSNTTSSHQTDVRRAIPEGATVFHVECSADKSSAEIWAALVAEAREAVKMAEKSRPNGRRPSFLARAAHLVDEAERCRQFFGPKATSKKPFKLDLSRAIEEVKEKREKAEKKASERAAKIAKLVARFAPRMLGMWRNHEEGGEAWKALRLEASDAGLSSVSMAGEYKWGNAALRLSQARDRVETSSGAQVLVRTVKFLWPFVAKAKAEGTAVESATIERFPRLDNYAARSIDENGNLIVGCHQIAFEEVELIARALELPPFTAAEALASAWPQITAEEVALPC